MSETLFYLRRRRTNHKMYTFKVSSNKEHGKVKRYRNILKTSRQ